VTSADLLHRLRALAADPLPLPASGQTPQRHHRLMQIGRGDLSLARLAEAHFDAVAILAEADLQPTPGALYGVWAAELPGQSLSLTTSADTLHINGTKRFCSGAGLLDRALITVAAPDPFLIDIDLRSQPEAIHIDNAAWKSSAFALTNTATVTFSNLAAPSSSILKVRGWYLSRPGFWQGACGPASCWAGGAAGLVDYAFQQSRHDPHTLAHLGALHSLVWQMQSCLDAAGREIDANPTDTTQAHILALTLRHTIEQASTEILRRFARAYGPTPLAFDAPIAQRYIELDIYLRQCHAERDLEALGKACLSTP
jgi:alkylation response protein AidB-like acyl-CoA dehydrogenase